MRKLCLLIFAIASTLVANAQPFQLVYTSSAEGCNGRQIDWGDYDNDGDYDLVVAIQEDTTLNLVVNLYRNDGNDQFYFWEVHDYGTSGSLYACKFVDLNNDTVLDIVLGFGGSSAGGTSVFEGNGSGGFLSPVLLSAQTGSMAFADFDNDGDQDYLVQGWPTRVYRNNGNMVFAPLTTTLPNESLGTVAWGHVNGDTLLDIVTSGQIGLGDYHLRVYTNNGNNTFTLIVDLGDYRAGSIHLADFDEDNDKDIFITAVYDYGIPTTKLFRNNGSGVFDTLPQVLTGVNGCCDVADVNNDGHLDVVALGLNPVGGCIARMFEGDGSGFFTETNLAPFLIPEYPVLALCDYNGDSLVDLAVCGDGSPNNSQDPARIYRNNFSLVIQEYPATACHVYPSITPDKFTLRNNAGSVCTAELVTITGQILERRTVNGNSSSEFDLSAQAPGAYFVRVIEGDRVSAVRVVRE